MQLPRSPSLLAELTDIANLVWYLGERHCESTWKDLLVSTDEEHAADLEWAYGRPGALGRRAMGEEDPHHDEVGRPNEETAK